MAGTSSSNDDKEEYPQELREEAICGLTLCTMNRTQLDSKEALTLNNQHYQFLPDYIKSHPVSESLPPLKKMYGLIGERSKPYEKKLTSSDLAAHQNRLNLSKDYVINHLIPMLNKDKNLESGIQVKTYDLVGKEYEMVFKLRARKNQVLNGKDWQSYVSDHNPISVDDYVTVWMFRHLLTKKLCFVIHLMRKGTNPRLQTQMYVQETETRAGTTSSLPPKAPKRKRENPVFPTLSNI